MKKKTLLSKVIDGVIIIVSVLFAIHSIGILPEYILCSTPTMGVVMSVLVIIQLFLNYWTIKVTVKTWRRHIQYEKLKDAELKKEISLSLKTRMLNMVSEGAKHYINGGKRGTTTDTSGEESCTYTDGCGGYCFIGRLLTESELKIVKKKNAESVSISKLFSVLGDIPAIFSGIPLLFLNDCQSFHDSGSNWMDNSITTEGLKALRDIKHKINNGHYSGQK